MRHQPEHYPEDWKHDAGPFAKAFKIRDATALHQKPPSNELLFRRLCLAHDDFEDAAYAAECLTYWDDSSRKRETAAILERPAHVKERRSLLLRNCYETTMVVAYMRPFAEAKGLPKFSFKRIGLVPKTSTNALCEKLKKYRNQWFAHSDPEVRRFLPPVLVNVGDKGAEPIERMSNPIFPKGGVFDQAEVHQVATMIFEINAALRNTMLGMSEHLAEPLKKYIPPTVANR